MDVSCPELMENILPCMVSVINITCEPILEPIMNFQEADIFASDVEIRETLAVESDRHPREMAAMQPGLRSCKITFAELATRWYIGLDTANATLLATAQEGMRFVEGNLER